MLSAQEITRCRICQDPLPDSFIDLGAQPPANNLLNNPDEEELSFPLSVTRCRKCGLVQLTRVVDPEVLFKHYLYVPSASQSMHAHFASLAESVMEFCGQDPLVVDIGSNDGLLLSFLKKMGHQVVGVEPAENLAREAGVNGIPTLCDFFGPKAVDHIRSKYGRPDVITATNVFAHVDEIDQLLLQVTGLLTTEGVFIIEVPWLLEMIEQGTFDMIYHEHLSYFALRPLIRFFADGCMDVFRVEEVPTHGGSLRVFTAPHGGKRAIEGSVGEYLARERAWLDDESRYLTFAHYVQSVKRDFTALINERKLQGKRIAGYGLPAKANTLINYCGLTSKDIEYIVDDNPLKQSKWSPGGRIPVVDVGQLDKDPVDCIVIFPWNLAQEIKAKLSVYEDRGVELIVPVQEEMPHIPN